MKTISIRQPWASLIVHGVKDIENRTWKCPRTYIGKRILVHASIKPADLLATSPDMSERVNKYFSDTSKSGLDWDHCPYGAIIGSVVIADCVQNHPSVWAEKGVWNWVLKDAILFDKPIFGVKGKLSFWDYDL